MVALIDSEGENVDDLSQPKQNGRRTIDIPASRWKKKHRKLEGNDKTKFEFKFDDKIEKDPLAYELVLVLEDGTQRTFAPGGGSGSNPEADPDPDTFTGVPEQGAGKRDVFFPTIVRADDLHREQITGLGVTVAVVDTGMYDDHGLRKDLANNERYKALYDAIEDRFSETSGSGSRRCVRALTLVSFFDNYCFS